LATIYKRAGSPYWQARIKSANGYERISTGTRDRREAQKTADEAEAELAQLLVKALTKADGGCGQILQREETQAQDSGELQTVAV
jgi:hypothetical protein